MAIQDGGPAFPMQRVEEQMHRDGYRTVIVDEGGMTLRDWFAGQAIGGLLMAERQGRHVVDLVRHAYQAADAMLAEREKGK